MHFLYDMITQIKQIPSKNYTISSHENLGQLCTGEGDFNSWPAIDLFPIKAEVEEEAGVVVHFLPTNVGGRRGCWFPFPRKFWLWHTIIFLNIYISSHAPPHESICVLLFLSLSLRVSPLCLCLPWMIRRGLDLRLRQRRGVFVCSAAYLF